MIMPQMNATWPYWGYINIGSGNGFLPPDNKPLSKQMLTQIDICRYTMSLGPNELTILFQKSLQFILNQYYNFKSISDTNLLNKQLCHKMLDIEIETTLKMWGFHIHLFTQTFPGYQTWLHPQTFRRIEAETKRTSFCRRHMNWFFAFNVHWGMFLIVQLTTMQHWFR